jgi:hypothetical protein
MRVLGIRESGTAGDKWDIQQKMNSAFIADVSE